MKDFIQSVFILFFLSSASGAPEIIYAQVGGTLILKTPIVDNLRDHYVDWFFNDESHLIAWRNRYDKTWFNQAEPWQNRLALTPDKLTITNIQEGNYGTFICKVKDALGKETTKQYKLLKFNVNLNSTFLLPGDRLSLTCDAETTPNHTPPRIHWLNPQGLRPSGATQRQIRKTVTSQDNGQWTCVVTTDNKESRAHVSVSIMDLLPAAPVPTQYTSTSSPLSLPCSIPSHISWDQVKAKGIQEVHWHFCSKPDPGLVCNKAMLLSLSPEENLTWKKYENRELMPASDTNKGNLSLVRNVGGKQDRGDYTCTMKFKNGVTISRQIHVEFLQIISSPGTELIYGQQVNLNCSCGGPLTSDLQVKWIPPRGASLRTPKSGPHPPQLTIPEVDKGDNGKWRCELWRNTTRLASAFITLKIEPKFTVWMLVTISGATVIAVLLLSLIFILCYRRQRKMRHLRHRLCQCKNPQPRGFYKT